MGHTQDKPKVFENAKKPEPYKAKIIPKSDAVMVVSKDK